MTYVDTKHVAAHLRKQLKTTFPGVKFSVRCDRGTASTWIDVTWIDGPDENAVKEITGPLRGSRYDQHSGEYTGPEPLTVVTKEGTITGEPLVDGINTHRSYSDAVLAKAAELWRNYHDGIDLDVARCHWQDPMDVEGEFIRDGNVDAQIREIAAKVVLAGPDGEN